MTEKEKDFKESIIKLTNMLNGSSNEYYNGKEPTLTDEEFDSMLEQLKSLEKETDFYLDNSPTRTVGYPVLEGAKKQKLPKKMLSLDKFNNDFEKLYKWTKGLSTMATLKLDGLSCMIVYKKGQLVGAFTRGDGTVGTDVTEMIKTLPSVPYNLTTKEDVIVVGEAIIRQDKFDLINSKRKKEEQFSTARNLASGTIQSFDTKLGKDRYLEFVAFDIVDGSLTTTPIPKIKTQLDKLLNLKRNYFTTVPFAVLPKDVSQIAMENAIYELLSIAKEKHFPIDGIVVSYLDTEVRNKCKPTSKDQTHSIAFKFKDEEVETTIIDIEMNLSRTGTITPIAVFKTIKLDNTDVSRASLHNISQLRRLEIGIGDRVLVKKANQIIPQISVNLTKSDSYELIEECPSCKQPIEICRSEEGVITLQCHNPICPKQQLQKINHFLSKDALDISGLSEKTLDKLMSFGEIETLYDIFELPKKKEELIKKQYPSLGKKSVTNMCEAIENGSQTSLNRFLIGLGLEGVGKKTARDIVEKYPTIQQILQLSVSDLQKIQGIDTMATIIMEDIDRNKEHIEKLLQYITFNEENVEDKSNQLEGLVFVFTGSTEAFKNRKEVEEFVAKNGGKLTGSVSKKTNYLICNSVETSSKYKKAQELGIPIITDAELKEMVSNK